MKLEKSVDKLTLKLKVVSVGFRELNARWKGNSNRVEPILQR